MQSRADRCLFIRRPSSEDPGTSITAIQVDDIFGMPSETFLREEENAAKRFKTKPRIIISTGGSAVFNGSLMSQPLPRFCSLSQETKLSTMSPESCRDELVSTRAGIQYVGGSTRPDLSARCQLLASAVAKEHPDEATYKPLNKLVDIAHNTASDRLTFVPLDLETLRVVLHTNASFANADGMKSQLGFVIMLVDGKNNANIVHYASRRCTRVTRSVLAAELYALVLGFDHSVLVREICTEILERAISIDGMIASQTLFDIVTRLSSPTEKRLGIDIYSLQEPHRLGELRSLYRIPSPDNVSDPLTKSNFELNNTLRRLMSSNLLCVDIKASCTRIRGNIH
jgi:hypothetical protein